MAYIRSGRPAPSRRGVTFVPGGLARASSARRFALSSAPLFLKPVSDAQASRLTPSPTMTAVAAQ